VLPLTGDVADLKRARIVLLAAAGRSTRSIAKEVRVQPRIVRLWRHRYADHGLKGLQDKSRPGKQPIYAKATDKRILGLLDKPRQRGARVRPGPCWPGRWATLTSNMSGGSCSAIRSTSRLASPGVRATTRTLRPKPPMLLAAAPRLRPSLRSGS
jgi:Helix-turn-helix domain